MHVKETITAKLHKEIKNRQFCMTKYCTYVRQMPKIMNIFIMGHRNVMLTGRDKLYG